MLKIPPSFSGSTLPQYGVEPDTPKHEAELAKVYNSPSNPAHLIYRLPQILENSEKWGVDMFRISELTDKKTLMCVTYTIFQERDLIKTFKIPGKVFLNFLRTLEDHYLQVNTLNTMLNASDCLFQLPSFA